MSGATYALVADLKQQLAEALAERDEYREAWQHACKTAGEMREWYASKPVPKPRKRRTVTR